MLEEIFLIRRWFAVAPFEFISCVSMYRSDITGLRFGLTMLCSSSGDCWNPTCVRLKMKVEFDDPQRLDEKVVLRVPQGT